jgi:hypothetical protein
MAVTLRATVPPGITAISQAPDGPKGKPEIDHPRCIVYDSDESSLLARRVSPVGPPG